MVFWFGKKKKEKEAAAAAEAALALEAAAKEEAAAKDAADLAERERLEREQATKREAENQQAELVRAQAAQDAADQAAKDAAAQEAENLARAEQAKIEQAEAEQARLAQEQAAAVIPEPEPEPEPAPVPEPAITAAEEAAKAETKSPGFFSKLSTGLKRSSSKLSSGITGVFTKRKLDEDTLEELEDLLIMSDMGTAVARRVTKNIAKDRFEKEITDEEIKSALASEITDIMSPREQVVDFSDGPRPRVVLFVGVNGSGKTTTIGKIASRLQAQGAKAMLVAADTFRAAAIEQLTVWGERAGIPVIAKAPGADAAGLVYEAVEKAKAENFDLVLVDTAGRLQNKTELMSELAKVVRVVQKLDPDAPHDVILVLDATVGQNALSQVEAFRHTAGVTGLVMTKLDGTAKGGVLVAIAEAHALPIHFVGVGERAEDLQPFSAEAYAKALVGLEGY
ncbi:MAG: signal recognition particle-docking protein FtsY [Hyphomonadaceae bacterium]